MTHILSNNKGGLSNRLKSIASCIRMANFNLDHVCVEWEVISNYKHDNHILNCEYKKLIKYPKEHTKEDIKIKILPKDYLLKRKIIFPKIFKNSNQIVLKN